MQQVSPESRSLLIKKLVETHKVHSQEEFISLLAEEGFSVTQATLSRYLKKMRIYKQTDATGESWYRLPAEDNALNAATDTVAGHILSISFSGQMGVIKTHPGCAGMVGAVIDRHSHPELMGTVAGDDILLLVLREKADHKGMLAFLETIIPGLSRKLR